MTPLRGYPALTALLAQELATTAPRIAQALEVLADARSPLKAGSYEAIGNNTDRQDPSETWIAAKAARDRWQLIAAIKGIDSYTRTLNHIVNEWAPTPIKGSNNVWCDNHQRHRTPEPQATGSSDCRWCTDVKRNYGTYPNRNLIDQHDKGRRISETEYRRQLGKGVASTSPHATTGKTRSTTHSPPTNSPTATPYKDKQLMRPLWRHGPRRPQRMHDVLVRNQHRPPLYPLHGTRTNLKRPEPEWETWTTFGLWGGTHHQ